MTKHAMTALLGAVCLLVGWMVASVSQPVVEAQETSGEWRMAHSQNGSRTWLYSARTGRVYKILLQCGGSADAGCLVPLPVARGDSALAYSPESR